MSYRMCSLTIECVLRQTGAKTAMPLGHVFLAINVEAFTGKHICKL